MTVVPVGGVSGDAADLLSFVRQSVLPPGAAAVAPPGAAAGAAAHPLAGEGPVELLDEAAGDAPVTVVLVSSTKAPPPPPPATDPADDEDDMDKGPPVMMRTTRGPPVPPPAPPVDPPPPPVKKVDEEGKVRPALPGLWYLLAFLICLDVVMLVSLVLMHSRRRAQARQRDAAIDSVFGMSRPTGGWMADPSAASDASTGSAASAPAPAPSGRHGHHGQQGHRVRSKSPPRAAFQQVHHHAQVHPHPA